MGLDITIWTDNSKAVRSVDYHDPANDYFNLHSLSRTFCNFMCRQNIVGEPELDQIGRITNIDISPLYEMETYQDEKNGWLSFQLEDPSYDREALLEEARQSREKLKGNIDIVLATISLLIDKLSVIDNLHELLNDGGHDTLGYKTYFTDFNKNKGKGYIGNNFGQDLRNFKRFLEFAKEKGARTVYFLYG